MTPSKVLFVNPNSTSSMTDKVLSTARAILPEAVLVEAVSNPEGPASIQGVEDGELAIPGMLKQMRAGIERGADALVIACFDDTGLIQARQLSDKPVLGIGQAAYHLCLLQGLRFTVVTTLSVSVPVLEANIRSYGLSDGCCRVRASEVPVLDLEVPGSKAEERVSAEIDRAIAHDDCDAIVLGCAGMTDLAARLSCKHGLPVIDGVAAAASLSSAMILANNASHA